MPGSLCANPHTLEGQNAVKKSLDAEEATETMHGYQDVPPFPEQGWQKI